jgi:acyl-CoA synthetase (AMP-forming)/AMP-acid ligase II
MPDEGIGVCYPGVDVRLVDEDGRDVPDGQTGELIARSPGMMLGYVDDPIATARAFLGDWFRTGDLAWRDAAGRYYLAGRATLRINVGGLKVAPEEVETVLAQHPAVREAVVFANPDAGRGEVVWAAIIPRDPAPTAAELRRFCRERLAPHKVPRGFEFYEEFPRSLLGKVLRSQLTS